MSFEEKVRFGVHMAFARWKAVVRENGSRLAAAPRWTLVVLITGLVAPEMLFDLKRDSVLVKGQLTSEGMSRSTSEQRIRLLD